MKFSRRPIHWKGSFVAALLAAVFFVTGFQSATAQNRPMGTDVSSYQGTNVVWSTMRTDGLSFAWAKATEGTYFIDADFVFNETHATAAGVYIGAYHFARPSDDPNITGANSADSEAQYFWNIAGPYVTASGGYLVPMLDWEDPYITNNASLTASVLSQWVNEWCNDVSNYARANGVFVKPVVYTGSWYSEPSSTYAGLNSTVTVWPTWVAAYPSCTKVGSTEECGSSTPQTSVPSPAYPWTTWNIWQYGDTNWSGGDSDVFNGTTNQFLQLFAIGYAAAPAGTTLYWDATGRKSSPGSGGTGSWDTVSENWWLSGSSDASWSTAGNTPIFAGTAGTVTLNASLNSGNLTFNTAGYTIAGTSTLAITNNPATFTVPTPSTSPVTLSCILTGGGYTVTGGGGLILNNAANSLSGSVTIGSNTTLEVASTHAMAVGSGTVTINAGGVFQNNDSTSNDLFVPSTFNISLGAGSDSLGVTSGSLTCSTVISGSGKLMKTGAGALVLTGANTYSGGTTVSHGILTPATTSSINSSSAISVAPGGTFDVSRLPSWSFAGNFSANGKGTIVGASAAALSTVSNGVINMGSAPMTLIFTPTATNGDTTHPPLYVSQGILQLNHGNTIVVSNGSVSPLGVGTYLLIQQVSGSISNAPYPTPFIEGSGVSPGTSNSFLISGGELFLVVARTTTTTLNSLSPSAYGQAVTFTATVSPSPSGGTVQFYDSGSPIGSVVGVNNGTASFTASGLAVGNHSITALYNGVTFYAASLSAASVQQVTAAPLTITASPQSKTYGQTLTFGSGNINFSAAGLANSDTVGSVTLAVSGNGGAAGAPVGSYVLTPSAATGGTFSAANYSISYLAGALTVNLPPNTIPVTANNPSMLSDGTVQLTFSGTPGYVYYIQATCDMNPPVDWTTISTNAADTNGVFNFIDPNATNYTVRFYRTQAE